MTGSNFNIFTSNYSSAYESKRKLSVPKRLMSGKLSTEAST